MDMENGKTYQIDLTDLLLDPENPRHDIIDNQPEILEVMAKDPKTHKLARDVASHGLNPLEKVLVMGKGKRFLVLEGNRRTSALKLLNEPDLVPSAANKYRTIQAEFDFEVPDKVECVYVSDRDIADHWLRIKHGGQLGGVGTVDWNAELFAIYNQRRGVEGESSLSLQLLDYATEKEFIDVDDRGKFPITTLNRLVNDAEVRKLLKLEKSEEGMTFGIQKEEVDKLLQRIVKDVATKKIKARSWYEQTDRLKYIKNIAQECSADLDNTVNDPYRLNSGASKSSKKPTRSRKKETPDSLDRGRLIPAHFTVKIAKSRERINTIYVELKLRLNIKTSTNAVSVLYRVFMELGADAYMDSCKIPATKRGGRELSLRSKLEKVVKHMEDNSWIEKKHASAAKRAISSESNIMSVDTFNAYVHSEASHPNARDLNTTWNNMSGFFAVLLERI